MSSSVSSTVNTVSESEPQKNSTNFSYPPPVVESLTLIGIGYPLVDIIQRLPDRSVLEKYHLNDNDAILAQEQHLSLYTDLLNAYHSSLASETSTSMVGGDPSSGATNSTVYITAGGSTLNTIRIAVWIIESISNQQKQCTTKEILAGFIGRIGNDEYSLLLEKAMDQDNVVSLCEKTLSSILLTETTTAAATSSLSSSSSILSYQGSHSLLPTGTSAVLVHQDQRSLVTYLGISRYLTLQYVQSIRIQEAVRSSKYIYSCGFMCQYAAPEHYDIVRYVSELTLALGHIFSINLSAEYICRDYSERLLRLINRSSYVFGNEAEALVLGRTNRWIPVELPPFNGDPEDDNLLTQYLITIGQCIAKYNDNDETTLPSVKVPSQRTVIITRGSKPALLVTKNGKVLHVPYPLATILTMTVIDPTGAGDAFVGGFLGTLILNDTFRWYDESKEEDLLIKAIEIGHWTARQIIKEIGVRFDRSLVCPLFDSMG